MAPHHAVPPPPLPSQSLILIGLRVLSQDHSDAVVGEVHLLQYLDHIDPTKAVCSVHNSGHLSVTIITPTIIILKYFP